jgi:MFS family permease
MNRNLWLLTLLQGLFLTNNVAFIAINGLVGFALAPKGWMATLPVMGYVLGGALCTGIVARTQAHFGRQRSFQLGLAVAAGSALLGAYGVVTQNFWVVCAATVIAGYYSANAHLYRFVAAELAAPSAKEKAVSWVLAGGLLGAVAGPNLAQYTRDALAGFGFANARFAATYVALAGVAVLGLVVAQFMRFADHTSAAKASGGRPMRDIMRQPVFIVAVLGGSLGYGVMNLLMAATPLAMQQCGLPFSDAAFVLEWHVIGMFAPGFFTGHLIKRFGPLRIMAAGLVLNVLCVAVALTGVDLHRFLIALFVLGVGWNFLFTASTTLALESYRAEEKDRAQAAINFFQLATLALTSFGSGALFTTQGWTWLNLGSLAPIAVTGFAIAWLAAQRGKAQNAPV